MCRPQSLKKVTKSVVTLIAILAAFVAATFVQPAHAGSSASASASATAIVLTSIAITKTRDLSFGVGAQGDAAKVIAPTDAANSARFNVTGSANAAYNITLPANGTVNLTNGANTIAVSAFTSNPGVSAGQLSAAGSQVLSIGATRAALSATQAPGTYTGSFTVTVTYQ